MLPLLSLHTLAVHRGDGLRPELRALLLSQANQAEGLRATIEFEDNENRETQANSGSEPETDKRP